MKTCGFFINYELRDVEYKYGFKNLGIFTVEKLKKGQALFRCDPLVCNYLTFENYDKSLTKDEVEKLIKLYPESEDFIKHYSFMTDDDAYDFPCTYKDKTITEHCMYFNHSCDGNCGFATEDCGLVVAKRDIEIGEELTYDYQLMDVEASFYDGLNCKCGSHKCRGVLRLDYYRNVDWITENYKYASILVKKHIDELKTKWYSSSCYLKKYNDKTKLGLTSLKKIAKNELVGMFLDPNNITREVHYFRHSDNPTCYVDKSSGEVFAFNDIETSTELTLNFNN